MTMKRTLIGAAALVAIAIGVYVFSRPTYTTQWTKTVTTSDTTTSYAANDNNDSLVIDTAGLFDLAAIHRYKPDPAAMAEAVRLDVMTDTMQDTYEMQRLMARAVRLFPARQLYWTLSNAVNDRNPATEVVYNKLRAFADSISWPPSYYLSAARYALAKGDSDVCVRLLGWSMADDSTVGWQIAADSYFQRLDAYQPFYRLMDEHLSVWQGQAAALRTMAHSSRTSLPYDLTPEEVFRKHGYENEDGFNGHVYNVSDDAMRDLIRGNRNRYFSRSTDHSVNFVASLHLSDSFYTYIYADQDLVNMDGNSWDWETFDAPSGFVLINIDRAGHKLGEQKIGCSCSPIHITTAVVDSSGLITSTDLKQIWKKNPLSAGYKGNKVVDRKVLATHCYQVAADGKINPLSGSQQEVRPVLSLAW